MDSSVITDMLEKGQLQRVGRSTLEQFLAGEGLAVLFFAGSGGRHNEAHDVAVALRELIKDYHGSLRAGLVDGDEEADLQSRFRVQRAPSLALVHEAVTLEVIPGVRDWADYARALQRYLGNPQLPRTGEAH